MGWRAFKRQKYAISASLVEFLDPLALDDIFDSDLQAKVRLFVVDLKTPGHWSWRSEQAPRAAICSVLGVPMMCVVGEWVHEVPVVTAS